MGDTSGRRGFRKDDTRLGTLSHVKIDYDLGSLDMRNRRMNCSSSWLRIDELQKLAEAKHGVLQNGGVETWKS